MSEAPETMYINPNHNGDLGKGWHNAATEYRPLADITAKYRRADLPSKVKALEWNGDGHWYSGDDEGWLEEAEVLNGNYYAIEFGCGNSFKFDCTFGFSQDGFDTPEDAKAAAQAHFEALVLGCLVIEPSRNA